MGPGPDTAKISAVAPQSVIARCCRLVLFGLLGLVVLAVLPGPVMAITRHFMWTQDLPVIALLIAALLALRGVTWDGFGLPASGRTLAALAALTVLLCWAGAHWLMADFALSRDELMVDFDWPALASGQLAQPLDPFWRPFSAALLPDFLLDVPGHAALVSGYLPVNALLHGAFGAVFDPALYNPLLAALGAAGLWSICGRLFAGDRTTRGMVMLLYFTSAQVLIGAMTRYAMTGHLALNLVWLACFLRGGKAGHAGAIGAGFLATGLHQLAFHPVFAAPFLAQRLWRREWGLSALYALAYALILLFWLAWPQLVTAHLGLSGASGHPAGSGGLGDFFTTRVAPLLLNHNPATAQLMASNLLRFAAWQNLALLPLLVAAWPALRGAEGIARPLAAGLLLTTLMMTLVLPYQGHGWGYRYLHGLIGSAVLLAGYGWQRLMRADAKAGARGVAALTCATLPAVLYLALRANLFVAPYAQIDQRIGAIDADLVVIDTDWPSYARDLVRNRADLSNRPLRLDAQPLNASDLAALCRKGSIAFVSRETMPAIRLLESKTENRMAFAALIAAAQDAGCRLVAPAD